MWVNRLRFIKILSMFRIICLCAIWIKRCQMPRLSGAPAYNRTAQSHPFLIYFITEYDIFLTKKDQNHSIKSWKKLDQNSAIWRSSPLFCWNCLILPTLFNLICFFFANRWFNCSKQMISFWNTFFFALNSTPHPWTMTSFQRGQN